MTDPRLSWLSLGVKGLPVSSCGRGASDLHSEWGVRVWVRGGVGWGGRNSVGVGGAKEPAC